VPVVLDVLVELDVLLAVLAADDASVTKVSVSVRIAMTCSSSLNCANCDTKVVLSVGLSGSWFCSCATRSCKNICSVGAVPPNAEATLDELLLELDPNELTAEAIKTS